MSEPHSGPSGNEAKRWLAGVFDRAAPSYDEPAGGYHASFGERLVQLADVGEGDVVLDVACGRGAALIPAARRVGPAGAVTGVDLSPEMVRLARQSLAAAGLAGEVSVMDAERLLLPASTFTVVLCAFGLFFLPRPERAMAEFRRVLKPGGVVAVSSWGEEDERWAWENELFGDLEVGRRAIVHPFDSAGELEDLLVTGGFRDVVVHRQDYEVHLADENEWWAWKWSYSLRGVLEQLPPERLERLRQDVTTRYQAMPGQKGLPLRLRALMAIGRHP